MQSLEWKTADLVFEPNIDADHRKLFEDLEKLRRAVELGNPNGQAALHSWHLSKSFAAHFAGEERLMRRSDYPGLDWHERQHHAGRKKMARLASAVHAKNQTAMDQALQELAQWLTGHIGLADRMFAAHLRNDLRCRFVS
ncbi:MAG TPA: hemerythrin family protein [Terracidiphilus sp.]|nr:hemerythrin family protein [Terracidiphilus sp.]